MFPAFDMHVLTRGVLAMERIAAALERIAMVVDHYEKDQ